MARPGMVVARGMAKSIVVMALRVEFVGALRAVECCAAMGNGVSNGSPLLGAGIARRTHRYTDSKQHTQTGQNHPPHGRPLVSASIAPADAIVN
ncbi:MAG TPA: hypothetical protein VFU55_09190 [Terracidiphilus sp.]|nr:hypothetical protein [Terracidiphilus sp.]